MSRAAALGAGAFALAAAAGCLSKAALTSQSYSIDPPAAVARTPAAGARILEIGRVDVAPSYDGRSLAYRTGVHRLERDPYARFDAPPGAMLEFAIRGYLVNADFVRDVVQPGSGLPADARIEVTALDLYGDLPDAGEAAGVLSLQFRVLSRASGMLSSEFFLKTYSRRVPVPQRTAAALVDAWNQGLAAIVSEFLPDLKAALDAGGPRP